MLFGDVSTPTVSMNASRSPDDTAEDVSTSRTLPEVLIDTDEHRVTDEVIAALAKSGDLFTRNGTLARVIRNDEGHPSIWLASAANVREEITRCVRFVCRYGKEKQIVRKHPPKWNVEAAMSRRHWPGMRVLNGLVPCPVVRADGSILSQSGYDEETGLYVADDLKGIEIPENPTQEDARQAAELLLDLTTDFPFNTDADRSVWLAACLTPFARWTFKGPTPMIVFDANCAGSGKTLLAEIVGLIFTGRSLARTIHPSCAEEARKLITSLCISGTPLILLDNVVGRLGCPPLDAAITSGEWRDRILKTNETYDGPMTSIWLATGNNLTITGDTLRRVFRCRLASNVENPQDRSGFKYPNLTEHIRKNLPRYRRAALVILSAYLKSEQVYQPVGSTGSFEQWSRVVRGAITFAGQPDPNDTTKKLRADSHDEANSLQAMFNLWPMNGSTSRQMQCRQIIEAAKENPEFGNAVRSFCDTSDDTWPTPKSLGTRLTQVRETIFGGQRLERRVSGGISTWYLKKI